MSDPLGPVDRFPAGTPVEVAMTKWGDRPHWRFLGYHLGVDEHGEWLGFPQGTFHSRPGLEFHSEVPSVTLVHPDRAWVATFHAPGIRTDLYVDIATPPVWDGDVLRSVDLDLDVIRRADGSVLVDDEDEFADHRVRYGYPAEIVRMAEDACRAVHDAVVAGRTPFVGIAQAWLARVSGLPPR